MLYSNIKELNDSIVTALNQDDAGSISESVQQAINYTGVDIIVYQRDNHAIYEFNSLDSETDINLEDAILVSESLGVYRIVDNMQQYYFTTSTIRSDQYDIYILRAEGSIMNNNETIILTSFIGIVFLIIAITIISILSTKTFAEPATLLASYVNNLSFQDKPMRRPKFRIMEFEELSIALEKAHLRVYQYAEAEKEFLHNFSHEMKTPLTNIYSYAEAMYYGMLSEEEAKNASSIIMDESEKLRDFINQVLYLGRLDSIGNTLNVSKVNLVNLIADSLNTVDIQAREKQITLEFVHAQEDVYLFADSDKLEVAITNLIHNALRYAKSKIKITLLVKKEATQIIFEDDGKGLDEDIINHIWERYYIGSEGHTGLGLTITKSIVEKHLGTIEAMNNDGAGAKFVITFPSDKKIVVSL